MAISDILSGELQSGEGSRLITLDTTPPTLTVTSPANGLVTAASSVTVSGTVTDNVAVGYVKVNGTAATISGSNWSASVSLSAGSNTITVVAGDTSGNTATATRTVTRATGGPSLTITSPANGLVTAASSIAVTGTVSDSVSPVASVTVNGTAATISGSNWSATVSLSGGSNTITVTAKNQVGLATIATRTVTRATQGPVLTITAPPDGLVTAAASITVSGTVSDSLSPVASVTVNGTAATISGTNWSATVSLSGGSNTITVKATNQLGLASTATRTVTRATSGPALAITSPSNGLVTAAASVAVSGTVSDSVSPVASVTVNGVAATISGSSWSATVSLSEGSNTITATATNQVGLSTTKSVSVVRDSAPPVIAITSPASGYITTGATLTVTGTVSDNVAVASVTVNGTAAAVSGTAWSVQISLTEGLNTITAVAADQAGNSASSAVTVRLDTTPPALSITSPLSGDITNQPAMTVTGTASDSGSGLAAVTVNGAAAAVSGAVWSAQVTLSEGLNTITVKATDAAGLSTTKSVSVRLDTQAPYVSLVSPPQGILSAKNQAFVFRVADNSGGAGIDPASITTSIDGSGAAHTATEAGGVYTVTVAASGLTEGSHAVRVAVSDLAGNTAATTAAYQVDTVPPELRLDRPDLHRIVDWAEAEIAGEALDATSGVASVTVAGSPAAVDSDGRFSAMVPLAVGENTITVTATDQAGWSTTQTVWMLRMVTDRTQEDVDAVIALEAKPWWQFSPADKAVWQGVLKGAYKADDMNRVGIAAGYLADYLAAAGYAPAVEARTDWSDDDAPTPEQRRTYLDNVANIQALLPLDGPQLPPDMDALDTGQANDIETVLVSADRLIPLMVRSAWQSGELISGQM